MSYPLQSYLATLLGNDSVIKPLLGKQNLGRIGVYPYNHRDVIDPSYPLITIARYGSRIDLDKFSDSPFATQMDAPKIVICVYDKSSIDNCWAVYRRIRTILLDRNTHLGNQYFDCYKLRETLVRDDLFDQGESTFHLHSEYEGWVRENALTPIPVG